MSKWDYSVCGTGHAFQLLIVIFCKPWKHRNKMKEKDVSTASGMLDSSDSPCVWVFFCVFFNIYVYIFFQILGTVNKVRISSSYFIEHFLALPLWEGAGAQQGQMKTPCLSHSVTGQLLPSSEVVNEHRHTVCTHQVVWVSRERFVLPGFGVTCKK